jgi:hypothetical protein
MDRKLYQPTAKQIAKWTAFLAPEIPSDDDFKAAWAKRHPNDITGWNVGKRNWIIRTLSSSFDYQMGLWQARVDFIRGLGYQGKAEDTAYSLGYSRGWNNGEPFKGIDSSTVNRLNAEYGHD